MSSDRDASTASQNRTRSRALSNFAVRSGNRRRSTVRCENADVASRRASSAAAAARPRARSRLVDFGDPRGCIVRANDASAVALRSRHAYRARCIRCRRCTVARGSERSIGDVRGSSEPWSRQQAAQAASGGGGLMAAFKENPTFLVDQPRRERVVIAMIIERIAFQLAQVPRELEGVLRADQEARHRRQHRPRDQALRRGRLPDAAAREGGPHAREQGPGRDRRRDEREDRRAQARGREAHRRRSGRSRTSRRSSASSAPCSV